MDRFSKERSNYESQNPYRKIKTEQGPEIRSTTRIPQTITPHIKQQQILNLKKQFDLFKDHFERNIGKEEHGSKRPSKNNSMTTPNLLKSAHDLHSKIKIVDQIKKKNSLEQNSRRILESSVEMEEQQSLNKKSIMGNLQQKLQELFNKSLIPVLKRVNNVFNKTVKLQQFTSRVKYLYHKKHLKTSHSAIYGSNDREMLKRRNTYTTEGKQQESISTNFLEDKKILQFSIRNLLEKEKNSHESIYKKNRLIDLLLDQIQQLEIKSKSDIEILRKQIISQEQQYEGIIAKLKQQISKIKDDLSNKQYLIQEMKGKNKLITSKCEQSQLEIQKLNNERLKQIAESNTLKQSIKQLQITSKQYSPHVSTIQQLNQRILEKDRDLEFQKRYSAEQYRLLQKQLRDIDDGFHKIKATNEILKMKDVESDKEIKGLKKQLAMQRKHVRNNSTEDLCYSLLDKNKVDVEVEQLQNKVTQLEKLLEESELSRLKMIEQNTLDNPKQQKYSEEMYRSLKEFIIKLEGEIVEKDRRIWFLQSNISRVKLNKPELPTLFSPKTQKHSTPNWMTKNQIESNSTESPKIAHKLNQKMIESVVIDGFSLQNYI